MIAPANKPVNNPKSINNGKASALASFSRNFSNNSLFLGRDVGYLSNDMTLIL